MLGSVEGLGFQSLVEHAVIVTEEEKLPGFFNLVVVSELDEEPTLERIPYPSA